MSTKSFNRSDMDNSMRHLIVCLINGRFSFYFYKVSKWKFYLSIKSAHAPL